MSDGEHNESRKLRWWFWVVLLTPTIVCAAGNTLITSQVELRYALDAAMTVAIFGGIILNLLCSGFAARELVAVRGPNPYGQSGASSLFTAFFILNLILSVGGCGLGGAAGDALRQ